MKKVILTQVLYVRDEKKLLKAAAKAAAVPPADAAAAVHALAVKPSPAGCEVAAIAAVVVDRISTTDGGAADRREDEQLKTAARAKLRAAGRLDDPDDFGFGPAAGQR